MEINRALTDPPMPLGVETIGLSTLTVIILLPTALARFEIPIVLGCIVLWVGGYLILREFAKYDKQYFSRRIRFWLLINRARYRDSKKTKDSQKITKENIDRYFFK